MHSILKSIGNYFWVMHYRICLFIGIAIFIFGCKTQKVIPSKSETSDNQIVNVEIENIEAPVFDIWSADSLNQFQDQVESDIIKYLLDTISIIGVGDIMMGTNFPDVSYLPINNGKELLSGVIETLRDADVTFGNLEGVIMNEGGLQKNCNNPKLCYLFRSPEILADNLVDAGFDVMSLANNHAGDFGNEGRRSTMKVLDTLGLNYAGLFDAPYTIFERSGVVFGMVAFAPNSGTISLHDLVQMKALVTKVDTLVDILIVSFHIGAEGPDHQHVTRKTESYVGENRGNVYEMSRLVIDLGADVVFGHGPHVTRAIDVYKNKFIAYSMGNFCTYGRFNVSGVNGYAPIIKLFVNRQGKFLYGQVIPIQQLRLQGPKIDAKKQALKIIQDLTKKDFPESKLSIDDSGIISYIEN